MNERQTILLVDDSGNDLLFMRLAFKKAEFTFALREVCNGEEAIAYLKGEGPYSERSKFPLPIVMLMDLNMPKKNGFEVLAWVRAQPALKRLAIVILTASMRSEDVERAFDLGATSFLVKPSSLETLTAMMRCLGDWIKINHFPPLNPERIAMDLLSPGQDPFSKHCRNEVK
jgi:CheY-like chemotaxis protein